MISAWTKIEPDKNCYRYYAIWFEADLFDPFRVCCEWGRVGAKKHQRRVLVFQSWEEAHQYFKEMEELRLKRAIGRQSMKLAQAKNRVIIFQYNIIHND